MDKHKESTKEIGIDARFPLYKEWALKDNQILGIRESDTRIKKAIYNELIKYVEIGELKEEDIPKVHTIQNWISSYTHVFKQKATEYELEAELLRNP
ncbi:hypothetical protein C1645_879824 [Glomus cerebriforme]|uniref:Uncharacterized protein n=1 Tax=Glomus cerebriforme TaxID=658196 RepID=A0A397SF28_9GLOM|nr:hypothetical protein C1645_879824 [Glomus cerebriforme]